MTMLALGAPPAVARSARRTRATSHPVGLGSCFAAHRGRILFAYALFAAESAVLLARPWALGAAVDALLEASAQGLFVLVGQQLLFTALVVVRRMYDTRVYAAVYGAMVARLVLAQRARRVDTSRVAARSALSREIVDFFERSIPLVLGSAFSVGGSLVLLVLVDGWLAPLCLASLAPVYLLGATYARRSHALNVRLNDRLEKEVDVIRNADPGRVHRHFEVLGRLRVRLSDLHAVNQGGVNLLFLGLVAAALLRTCGIAPGDTGRLFAVVGYVTLFAAGLFHTPQIVQQLARLRDIQSRLRPSGRAA